MAYNRNWKNELASERAAERAAEEALFGQDLSDLADDTTGDFFDFFYMTGSNGIDEIDFDNEDDLVANGIDF